MNDPPLTLVTLVAGLLLCLVPSANAQESRLGTAAAGDLHATIEAELINTTQAPYSLAPLEQVEAEEVPLGQPIPDDEEPGDGLEIVRERYENGNVRVERHVVQDEQENYINHGPWRMWDPQQQLIAAGQYMHNQRDGDWSRLYHPNDASLFKTAIFDEFEPPFQSTAPFQSDQLEGTWTITDSRKLKIVEWNFTSGKRHGKSTWWYPNGQCMKELNYDDGVLNGELLEWLRDGMLVTRDRYDFGRRITKRTEKFPKGQKKSEGVYRKAKLETKELDDWWNAEVLTYAAQGKDEKHGSWISWYESGQKKVEGNYEDDLPEGQFVWWHSNGQKALRSEYQQGKEHGDWTWWHENGQKSISGAYAEGTPTGRWIWWDDNGKVAKRFEFTADGQAQELAIDSPTSEVTLPDQPRLTLPPPTPDRSAYRSVLRN